MVLHALEQYLTKTTETELSDLHTFPVIPAGSRWWCTAR